MYEVRLLPAATRDLARLEESLGGRIVERLRWLAGHVETCHLDPLRGELAGLYKFRVGDYRVIIEKLPQEQTIVVHAIGHRRDVYRKR